MSFTLTAEAGVAWMAAGAVLALAATLGLRRLRAWREARLGAEWDPY